MSESDRWLNAIEHLKSAFKDESTISNIAQANLSMLEEDGGDDAADSNVSSSRCCSVNIDSTSSSHSSEEGVEKDRDVNGSTKKMHDENDSGIATGVNKESPGKHANIVKTITDDTKNTTVENITLINVDEEYSYRSCEPEDEDRYNPGYYNHSMSHEEDMPGIIDVSSIQSEHNQDNQGDADMGVSVANRINLSISQEEDMKVVLQREHQRMNNHLMMDENSLGDPDDDLSSSAHTGTTSGGSLLLNLWNEDYEGNPDPHVMRKLIEAKRLPRKTDPYILNQIERAKIIKQLEEYEDDDSSHGSCNVLCSQFFIPRQCVEDEDDDDGSDSDDSIVDTVINFNTEDSEIVDLAASVSGEATMEFDMSDLNHKKPRQEKSMYAIPKDNEYRPGIVKNELVLKLPKKRTEDSDDDEEPQVDERVPIQFARGDDSTARRSKTYREKEMEFTLQKYDSTPNRIAELIVKGKTSAAFDIPSPCSELSSPGTFESEVDLEQLAFRERRETDDDDPIEEDRSVLSPEEIEAMNKAQLEYEKNLERISFEKKKTLAMKQKEQSGALSQIIGILNNKQSCAINNVSYACIEGDEKEAGKPDNINDLLIVEDNDGSVTDMVECLQPIPEQDENLDPCSEEMVVYDEETLDPTVTSVAKSEFLQDRLPLVVSSSSDSTMLNPVEQSRLKVEDNDVDLIPIEKIEEISESHHDRSGGISTNEDENVCPNKLGSQDDEIKPSSAIEEEHPVDDNESIETSEVREVLSIIGEHSSGRQNNFVDHKVIETRGCCAVRNTRSEDDNFEELVKIVEGIPSLNSESTTGENEEVVMGVTVEGVSFSNPSGKYGVIIEPQMLTGLEKVDEVEANKEDESEVNVSQSSEYYADMILNVTNFDDSMAKSDHITKDEVGTNIEETSDSPVEDVQLANQNVAPELQMKSIEESMHDDDSASDNVQKQLNETTCKAEITTDLSNFDYFHKIKAEVAIPDMSFGEMNIEVTDTSVLQDCCDIDEAKTDLISNVHHLPVQIKDFKTTTSQSIHEPQAASPPVKGNGATIRDDLSKLKESMKRNSMKLGKARSSTREESSLFGTLWNKA